MSDMGNGFLNFHADPRPYHDRVLERLDFLASREVWAWELDGQVHLEKPTQTDAIVRLDLCARAAMREMAFRICGTKIPAEKVDDVCEKMVARLETIAKKLPHSPDVEGTISWIKRTYL